MKFITSTFISAALLTSVAAMGQSVHVAGASGFGLFLNDSRSSVDRSLGLGAGLSLHQDGRWSYAATALWARERYSMKFEGVPTMTFDADRVAILGEARWQFLPGDDVPFIGVGLFGSRLIEDQAGLPLWMYGPSAGIGVQWSGGFLSARYQQSLDHVWRKPWRGQGMAFVTFALNVFNAEQ